MRIVKNGDVHVSAPIGMPREKVIAFIDEHKDWIEQARKRRMSVRSSGQSSTTNCH